MESTEHNPGEPEFGEHADEAPHNPGESTFDDADAVEEEDDDGGAGDAAA